MSSFQEIYIPKQSNVGQCFPFFHSFFIIAPLKSLFRFFLSNYSSILMPWICYIVIYVLYIYLCFICNMIFPLKGPVFGLLRGLSSPWRAQIQKVKSVSPRSYIRELTGPVVSFPQAGRFSTTKLPGKSQISFFFPSSVKCIHPTLSQRSDNQPTNETNILVNAVLHLNTSLQAVRNIPHIYKQGQPWHVFLRVCRIIQVLPDKFLSLLQQKSSKSLYKLGRYVDLPCTDPQLMKQNKVQIVLKASQIIFFIVENIVFYESVYKHCKIIL